MNTSLLSKAIFIGLVFAILGAVAPLIPESDLMPAYVRCGHAIEVSTSNFLYGISIALLLGQTVKQHSPDILAYSD